MAWIDNGQSVQDVRPINDAYVIQTSDIELLRKTGVSDDDIVHSVKVGAKSCGIVKISDAWDGNLDLKKAAHGDMSRLGGEAS